MALTKCCIIHVPYVCIDLNKPYNNLIHRYYNYPSVTGKKLEEEEEVTHLGSDVP